MRRIWAILIVTCVGLATPSHAQVTVISEKPDAISVTAYRHPDRGAGGVNARYPQGYALISETRTISVPAGDAVIRFEGVADGMIAVSAVVTGLPGKVAQKNRDARLLSPAALLDGSLGNRVHFRRTDPATGRVTEEDVTVRSASGNALVVETAAGFEGLQCSGLPEGLSYNVVPDDLSARPTFSVSVNSPAAATAQVTLTYLANGFDWGANYVARVAEDGRTLDLFAWLTVANGNSVSFPGAELLAVAGRPSIKSNFRQLMTVPADFALSIRCWPLPTYDAPLPPPPPILAAQMMEGAADIVVTAQRRSETLMAAPVAVMAVQEELGDLKLYRLPVRVDVSASGQKQVALLEKRAVPFHLYYVADIASYAYSDGAPHPLQRMIRMENRKDAGLGLPLPAGGTALFEIAGEQPLLVATGALRDHAEGETVELEAGDSRQLFYQAEKLEQRDDRARWRLTLSNADARAANVEIKLPLAYKLIAKGQRLRRRDGVWLWATQVPGQETAVLEFQTAAD